MSVVPPGQIRNRDVGDWHFAPNGSIMVMAADTGSWRYNTLLLIHEAVEAWLCRRHGVTEEMVNHWDGVIFPMMMVDIRRNLAITHEVITTRNCPMWAVEESPGDCPKAPYHHEHVWATRVERIASWLLLVSWTRYEDRVDELWEAQRT